MLTKQGIVTSAKMRNTVTVTVHQSVLHPIYKKRFRRSAKFLVDTAGVQDIQVGDEVVIQECKPLSKRKHFKIVDVLKRVPRVSEMKMEEDVEEASQGTRHKKKEDEENASEPSLTPAS
jgi:small subunit ribosomal protein S17